MIFSWPVLCILLLIVLCLLSAYVTNVFQANSGIHLHNTEQKDIHLVHKVNLCNFFVHMMVVHNGISYLLACVHYLR